ncbi:hypothetical protein DPMN_193658 [Dreissena polymorpha]|uniref:Uncharacterized protein n=1 Tax=Dreissena polymorpha TaxID=45954 RepID=A0A9D4BDD7_DREPO|nr:hypothetical protein DPMN_193658 [Dreissena polymorpha]
MILTRSPNTGTKGPILLPELQHLVTEDRNTVDRRGPKRIPMGVVGSKSTGVVGSKSTGVVGKAARGLYKQGYLVKPPCELCHWMPMEIYIQVCLETYGYIHPISLRTLDTNTVAVRVLSEA